MWQPNAPKGDELFAWTVSAGRESHLFAKLSGATSSSSCSLARGAGLLPTSHESTHCRHRRGLSPCHR